MICHIDAPQIGILTDGVLHDVERGLIVVEGFPDHDVILRKAQFLHSGPETIQPLPVTVKFQITHSSEDRVLLFSAFAH